MQHTFRVMVYPFRESVLFFTSQFENKNSIGPIKFCLIFVATAFRRIEIEIILYHFSEYLGNVKFNLPISTQNSGLKLIL